MFLAGNFSFSKNVMSKLRISRIKLELISRLSLKCGFDRCRHGFGGCDGFGGFTGFDGFDEFGRLGRFDRSAAR